MAESILERFFFSLGFKTDDLKKDMNKAESIINKGIDSIKDALMPLATGFAMVGMVTSFTEGANQVAKASERLGLSVEDLQAWQGAAEALGAEGAEVNEMITDMNEHLVDMVQFGGGPALEILTKLGISATDASGKIRPATDVLLDLAGATEKIGKQKMLAYGKMFGFDASMIDLLLQGRSGLEGLLKAQKELAVFNKEDAEIAKQAKIAWNAFIKSLQAVQTIIMRVVMPALVTLTNWLTKAVVWAKQNQPFMIALITALAIVIATTLVPAVTSLAVAVWSAMAPFIPLIGIVVALALAVDDFYTYLNGGESALATVWDYLIRFFSFFENAIEGIKRAWKGFVDFVTAIFAGEWEKVGQSLLDVFIGLIQVIYGLFEGLGRYILDLINIMTGGLVDAFQAKIQALFDWAGNAWGKAKEFFGFSGDEEEKQVSTELSEMKLTHKTPLHALSPDKLMELTAGKGATQQNNNISSNTSVGNITINTNATDAKGIAKSITPALKKEFAGNNLVLSASTGVIAK